MTTTSETWYGRKEIADFIGFYYPESTPGLQSPESHVPLWGSLSYPDGHCTFGQFPDSVHALLGQPTHTSFCNLPASGGGAQNQPMKNSPSALVSAVAIALILCSPVAYAASGNHGHRNISVSISPTAASVQVGQAQQFTATVSGSGSATVNWVVNGTLGGNSTVGTISSSGLYTAPAAVPSTSVTVTAQSVLQPAISASATISITASAVASVSVSPTSASLQVSQSQQFAAQVSGTSNTAVNWLVLGILGGNSTVGTISSSGFYTAPAAVPSTSVTVTAQSAAISTASANATVSIMPPPPVSVSISPTSSSLQVSQSQQFAAAVSGTTNTGVSWLVSGVLGGSSSLGTISAAGLYTAPASVPTNPVTVAAQSAYDPSKSATASVTITAPVAHSVNLSWTDSTSSLAGFNVYRSTQTTGPFAKITPSLDTATVYTDSTVQSGQTYYYATTAVDSSGVESSYSNIAQAVVP